jgi:hypothetical protein
MEVEMNVTRKQSFKLFFGNKWKIMCCFLDLAGFDFVKKSTDRRIKGLATSEWKYKHKYKYKDQKTKK